VKLSSAAPLALAFAMAAFPAAYAADTPPTPTQAPLQTRTQSELRADMVARVMPSVVQIEDFNKSGEETASGSGFVYNAAKGYILTNAHVVADKDVASVMVMLNENHGMLAKIVGFDKASDIAVLQLSNPAAAALPQATLDRTNTLRVANDVIAIGSPEDLANSVTKGIVSAFHRPMNQWPCDDYIQIDAAVNPGNSGGPLFNERGEVVGINSMILSSNNSFAGIAFSIPINQAVMVADELIAHGQIHWGAMGVKVTGIPPEVATALKLDPRGGLLIQGVNPDSAAAKAGLRKQDMIIGLNGASFDAPRKFECKVAELHAGTTVTIDFLRKGQERHVTVTLDDLFKKAGKPHHKSQVIPLPQPRPYHVPEARP
jgi:S1-C subfamily serine protease